MAYNHGREDRKWRIWKEAEEKLLRECGVDEATIEQIRIRIILDNHSAHTSKETRRFLDTMPKGRFKFVFTPKHGSWLNMIESFFSKMTRQMLRGIRVNRKTYITNKTWAS